MPDHSLSDLDVDAIMEKIRQEVAQRSSSAHDTSANTKDKSPVSSNKARYIPQVSLEEFLRYHDEKFLKHAYIVILNRPPDAEGLKTYVTRLRSGELSKIEILGRLRFSKEGRRKGVKIRGLLQRALAETVFKVPVIGYVIHVLVLMALLPRIVRHNRGFESEANMKLEQLSSQKADVRVFDHGLALKADATAVQAISAVLNNHQVSIADQQRRLFLFLEEAQKTVPGSSASRQIEALRQEEDHLLDPMYLAFEDRFRGTRSEIKERLSVYLTYVERVVSKNDDVLLDVGCGRGEWLELLKEHGFKASGIDLNRIMIQQCKERGLEAQDSEVLGFLREKTDNSYAVITGFHLIEHIPYRSLLSLLDEALRTIKPGGMVIFETPNPENLIVGSCNFYYDPTHRSPLPPEPMKFLLEQRGFINVEILRLHKVREVSSTGQKVLDEVVRRINMEQDYALIGYKA